MNARSSAVVLALLLSAGALGAAQASYEAHFAADTGGVDSGGADTGGADTGGADTAALDTGGETDQPDSGGDSEAPAADTGELDTAGEAVSLLSAAQVAGEKGGFGCSSAGAGQLSLLLGLLGLLTVGARRRPA